MLGAQATSTHAAASDPPAQLDVFVDGPDGRSLTQYTRHYTADELATTMTIDVVGKQYTYANGSSTDPLTGVSLPALIGQLPIPTTSVAGMTFTIPGILGTSALAGRSHDFDDPSQPGYPADQTPFQDELPPVFAPFTTGGDGTGPANSFTFAVQRRLPGREDPALASGVVGFAGSGQHMQMTLQLSTTPVETRIRKVGGDVVVDRDVTFSADASTPEPASALTWTWTFGDGGTATTATPGTTHKYERAGKFQASVEVTGAFTTGLSPELPVDVVDPSAPSPKTSPPAGRTGGTGNTDAPNVGPNQGSGARVGGVPTDRPGGGRAGATDDPRSATPSASGSASGSPAPGGLVGYVLSDPDRPPARQAQAASTPLDDSAPALRAGRTVRHVGAWLLATAVVVALLLIGAGSERRRPSHTRARRRPTRRAP